MCCIQALSELPPTLPPNPHPPTNPTKKALDELDRKLLQLEMERLSLTKGAGGDKARRGRALLGGWVLARGGGGAAPAALRCRFLSAHSVFDPPSALSHANTTTATATANNTQQ